MGDQDNVLASLFKEGQDKCIASIILNGYNIREKAVLGDAGAMRSFILKQGNLWDEWSTRTELKLISQDGRESRIRVAAHPADDESSGLIEFLPNIN